MELKHETEIKKVFNTAIEEEIEYRINNSPWITDQDQVRLFIQLNPEMYTTKYEPLFSAQERRNLSMGLRG